MLSSLVLLFLTTAAAVSGSVLVQPRAACNADLCLRSVRATQRSTQGLADCSSYWRTTYTPPTSTQYSTATIYVTSTSTTSPPTTITVNLPTSFTNIQTLGVQFNKRQQNPGPVQPGNKIPVYASYCSGTIRYSSACSCIGVSSISTVTAPTPITVITTSVTSTDATSTKTIPTVVSTSTVYTGPTATVTLLALQIASPSNLAGQYLKAIEYTGPDRLSLSHTTDPSAAAPIYLHQNGRLSMRISSWPGIIWAGAISPDSKNSVVFEDEQNFRFGVSPLMCTLGSAPGRAFTCNTADGWNTFTIRYGEVVWVDTPAGALSGSVVITLKAVPVPAVQIGT